MAWNGLPPTILVVLRSSATGVYPQFRRLIVSADGDVRQLADRACDRFLAVIASVEVRQRSGQFASVQIRNGIPWSDLLLPRMPYQFADRRGRHIQAATECMRLPHLQASSATCGSALPPRRIPAHPARVARAWRNEPDRPGVGAAGAGASRSGGLSFFRWRATGRRVHPSIRALTVPPPSPDSANWWKELAEPVPAPERLSTGAGSASCPRPGQGQDRNPAQRER